tara:strand:+ start:5459 stop:6319 length:861 start_codon:yes stop_codon:yes gene_type:complete
MPTITYDPSNDPVAIADAEARDSETLAVGQEMQKEQEQLLAGKYKNAEDLESAYIELQKKMGEGKPTEEVATPEPETTDQPQFYAEDGSVNYDSAKELYGDNLGDIFQKAEIDPFKMNEHFAENNGTLTDEMYNQLGEAGLNKTVVDAYLKGVRQEVGIEEAAAQPALSESEVSDLKGLAGGESGYNDLMKWASDNLAKDDIESFDDVLATGNKSAVKFAIKALVGQMEETEGRDSKIVTGKKPVAGDAYRSMAEVVRDMNKPEYELDPAYRADVQRKIERSNLNV